MAQSSTNPRPVWNPALRMADHPLVASSVRLPGFHTRREGRAVESLLDVIRENFICDCFQRVLRLSMFWHCLSNTGDGEEHGRDVSSTQPPLHQGKRFQLPGIHTRSGIYKAPRLPKCGQSCRDRQAVFDIYETSAKCAFFINPPLQDVREAIHAVTRL